MIVFVAMSVYVIVEVRQDFDDFLPDLNASFQGCDRSGARQTRRPAGDEQRQAPSARPGGRVNSGPKPIHRAGGMICLCRIVACRMIWPLRAAEKPSPPPRFGAGLEQDAF
ncbi:MAG: hypothetical protein WAU78_02525 [Roseiarcus sp.]